MIGEPRSQFGSEFAGSQARCHAPAVYVFSDPSLAMAVMRKLTGIELGAVIYVTWTFQVGYFVIMRRGDALGVGAAGEITNVTHVFQPSGRFSAANSL